jgi:hypothetical protein
MDTDEHALILWKPLRKDRAEATIEFYQEWVEYRGMLQGRIHNLYKEANPPYFFFRDFASGVLVRCEFPEKLLARTAQGTGTKDRGSDGDWLDQGSAH